MGYTVKHIIDTGVDTLWRLLLTATLALAGQAAPCRAQPSPEAKFSEIALEQTRPNAADLFAIEADVDIWHVWQNDKAGNWGGVESLGGIAKDLAVIVREDGRFEVFVVGSDDAIWHNVQLKVGWRGWESIGGGAKRVAVAKARGRYGVFVIASDDAVWWSLRKGQNGKFGAWYTLGGVAKQLAAAEADGGEFRVFVIGSDDAIYHRGTRDGDWQGLGGWGRDIAATRGAGGKLAVLHVGSDAAIYQARQTGPGPRFGDWQSLGGSALQCAVNGNSAQRGTLVTLGNDGRSLSSTSLKRAKPAAASGGIGEWRTERSRAPVDSGFDGRANVAIPDLQVSETCAVDLGLRFEPAHGQVAITRFPPLVTKPFHTPFGNSICTVTMIGGGTGTFDRDSGQIVIPVTLKFDQSLDVPGVQEDTQLDLELRTDREGGEPLDFASGHVVLAGSGVFRGKGAINPLKKKRCQMRIEGRAATLP